MKNVKNDNRSRYTQSIIKKSLLDILASKPLKSVTAAELCRKAEVTRGTFYNHFYDVFDVYENIENEFIDEIRKRLSAVKAYALDARFMKEILEFICQNLEMTKLIASSLNDSSPFKDIFSFIKDKYIEDFSERYPSLERQTIGTMFTYIINGSIGILLDWINGFTCLPPQSIAEQIDSLNKVMVEGYLKSVLI